MRTTKLRHKINQYRSFIKLALVLGILTIIFGTIYASGQFVLRASANDPQVELAENTAQNLANGTGLDHALPSESIVDIRTSLSPYVIIYDDAGNILSTNARLNNQLPEVPHGVLEYSRKHDEHRVTWQPESGTRSALVVKHFSGTTSGFVVAGRSLREVEKNDTILLIVVSAAWAMSIIASVAVFYFIASSASFDLRN